MPPFDRLLSRLRDLGVVLGDWFGDAGFFIRYHLAAEIKVRLASLIPETISAVRRAAKSEVVATAVAKTTSASSAVATTTAAVYERAAEVTPEPLKAGYHAATKTEGTGAAISRTAIGFVVLLLSFIGLVIGFLIGNVWLVLGALATGAFAALVVFTQEATDTILTESTATETIVDVSYLGDGYEAIISIRTVSLGGEVRDYSIMRDDLTIIDSREPRADVSRIVTRRVSRNAFGWVMGVEDIEYVEITAYTPLGVSENGHAEH